MNEIVFIPIPPLPPKISSCEISMHVKSRSNTFKFKEILFRQKNADTSFKDVDGIIMKNCLNADDALQMLQMQWFLETFNKSVQTFMIKIEIDELIDSLNTASVSKLMKNMRKKFWIILFQTFCGKCQIFWKYDEKSFWLKMDTQVSNFVLDFLASSMTNDHPGVSNDILTMTSSTQQILELDLLSLIDSRNYNLLMLAAEDSDAGVVDSLIQLGFDVNVLVNDNTAIDLAYNNHHFDIVLALLHANSLYPKNIKNSQITDVLKNFISISRELHNFIRLGRLDVVEAILNDNPNLRHFYNTKNLSAASQAVICGQFEIYDLLLSKSVYIGPKEDFNAILRKVSEKSCESMRGIHLEYIQSSSDKHLMILTVNSFVGHDVPDVDEKLKHITKAFNFLNKVDPLISLILKVVAASRDFKIIFDFHRQSIQHLDPTSTQFTRGVYHTSRHIYIAAQQMLNSETVHEIYGTMAHELCHYALHLVYHNDCRPYYDDELDVIKQFTRIALLCKLRQDKEPLISCVYNIYSKELQHAELIVRVPHMIAEYSNNPKKLQEIRQNFPELFQFAENISAVDMENSLMDIEIHAEDEIKKFAHRVKKQERENFWLWIFSVFCILTLPLMVYITLWMSDTSKPVYSCGNLTNQRFKIQESTVNFQGVPVIFKDLFGNSTDSCKNLTSDDLGTMLNIYDSKKLMDENVYKDLSDKNIIQNDHEPSKTAKILDKYKNTTVRQPSLNVSTKVELKAPFFIGRRVYQRLKGHNRNVFTFSELTRAKIMLLSDSAGNGKSTTFRRAAWKLKRTLPLHWISYVDLKEHVEALIEVNLNNTNASAIIDFLIDYIMQLKSEVDREIFNQKFLADNVIILWDGVDEISPICTEKILGLIDKISKLTNNSQWISTRVHLESIIAKRFNVYPYGLYYYNEAEKLNFIRKSLDIHKIVNETALIIEDRINSTILRLESPGISRNIQNKEIKTPLMIKMICDYQLDIFKEEDRNKTISSSSNILNIYRIYAYLVKKHFDIAYDNKSQIVKEDVEKIQEEYQTHENIHQFYALKEILGAAQLRDVVTDIDIEYKNLSIMQSIQNSTDHVTNEQITRFGIMYENSARQLKFEHRTFAEYFVAKYILDNLWDPYINHVDSGELKLRLQVLLAIIKNDQHFKVILDFIAGFIEVKTPKSKTTFGHKVRNIMTNYYSQLFHYLDNKANSIDIATKFFKKDKEIIKKLWKIDQNFTFFQETFNFNSSLKSFNELKQVVEDNFDENDQNNILNGNNQQIFILFRIWSHQYNHTAYNETISNLDLILDKLSSIDDFKFINFLEFIDTLNYSKSDFREFFRQTFNEILQYTAKDIVDFTKYWKFIDNKLDNKDIKLILFHKQNVNQQTIMFQIRKLQSSFAQIIFDFLENHLNSSDIIELLLNRDKSQNATLMSYDIESNVDLETLNLTWNFIKNHTTDELQKQLLSSSNGTIWTLKTVWTTNNVTTFEFYSQIFIDLFTKLELCDMIMELIESLQIFAINFEEHGKNESLVSTKRKDFLEFIFEGEPKRLEYIYSRIIDIYIR